jgi:hypothetical protein
VEAKLYSEGRKHEERKEKTGTKLKTKLMCVRMRIKKNKERKGRR